MAYQLNFSIEQPICLLSKDDCIIQYQHLLHQIKTSVDKTNEFELDFTQVTWINSIGVEEVILKVLETLEAISTKAHRYSLVLKNLSEDRYFHAFNIHVLLYYRKKAITALHSNGSPFCLGRYPKATQELLDVLFQANDVISPRMVAQKLNKIPNLVNTQLKQLYDLGVIHREQRMTKNGGINQFYSYLK